MMSTLSLDCYVKESGTISATLIETAVTEVSKAEEKPTPEKIFFEITWGTECYKVFNEYVELHAKVGLKDSFLRMLTVLQINSLSSVASIVQPERKTVSTFSMLIHIHCGPSNRRLDLLGDGDYYIIIPLDVPNKTPYALVRSSGQSIPIRWSPGLVVYLRGGLDLSWPAESGGFFFLLGGKLKHV